MNKCLRELPNKRSCECESDKCDGFIHNNAFIVLVLFILLAIIVGSICLY